MSRAAMLAALLLTGCASACDTGAPAVGADGDATTCNAAAWTQLIGQDSAMAAEVPPPKRVHQIGAPVTMDFNPARINLQYDEGGIIRLITCG